MFEQQLKDLPVEDRLAIAMTLPRGAMARLFAQSAAALNQELANLDYADKEVLQIAYVKLRAKQTILLELAEFFTNLPNTQSGDDP